MTSKWTFMVYMAGDNNLSGAGDEDLREMRQVGSTDDVNVVVQFDNAGQEGTRRYRVLRDGDDLVESLGPTDSGDPNVLLDFIRWAHATYPADRYALVLWNHGGGWEPSAIDEIAQQVRSPQYGARESVERAASPLRRVFFRPSLQTIMGLPSPQERAICSDDGTGHSLDTVELGKVRVVLTRAQAGVLHSSPEPAQSGKHSWSVARPCRGEGLSKALRQRPRGRRPPGWPASVAARAAAAMARVPESAEPASSHPDACPRPTDCSRQPVATRPTARWGALGCSSR